MNETDNQQPSLLKEEGSETIPKGSRATLPETGSALTSSVEGKDIVQVQNDRFANFLKKAKEKFENKFDYSKFIYINALKKSIIICPIHG